MARISYRTNPENHVILGEAIPLHAPFVLLVDPSNLCNFKCKFCPTGNKNLIKPTGRYNGLLDFAVYTKIIDDLEEFDLPIKTLRLYKEGEPLVHPKFADMVAYAQKSSRILNIDTTTNGALLHPKLNEAIVKAGMTQINISVNGVSAEQIYYYTQAKVNFDTYVSNIKNLYENRGDCEISIKAIAENLSEDEQKKFFDIFGNMANRIVLEHLSPAWPQFTFHKDVKTVQFSTGHYGQEAIERDICPYIFYIMVVNSDGRVSSCVGDWPHKNILGDVKIQSVKSIWQGDRFQAYRLDHVRGLRKNNDFCKACQVITYGTLENIDAYRDEILRRMTS